MPDISLAPKVFDRALIARHLERRPEGHDDFVTRLVLADLVEDAPRRLAMGKAGRARALERFTAPTMAAAFERLYDEVLAPD